MKTTRLRASAGRGVLLGIGLLAMTARCSSSSGGPGGGDDGGSNDSSTGNDSTVGSDDGSRGDEGTGDTGSAGHDAAQPDASDAAPADGGDATTGAQDAPGDSPLDSPGIVDVNLPDVSFFDAGDGGVCNSLAAGGPTVQPTRVIGTLPTGTGGTVEEGLYYLTAVTEYVMPEGGADAGTPGNTIGETVELISQGSGTFRGALALQLPSTTQSYNVLETYTSNTVNVTFTCNPPTNPPTQFTYTFDSSVTPHQFRSYSKGYNAQGTDAVLTFAQQ